MHLRLTSFILLLLLTIVISSQAFVAAQATTISVTPAILDAPTTPGDSFSRNIQIRNGGNQALPVSIELQQAVFEGEPIGEIDSDRYSLGDWISLEENTFVLEPNQTKKIKLYFNIPLDATVGGHYGQLSMRGLALEHSSSGQTTGLIFPEVSVPILVSVAGDLDETVQFGAKSFFPPTVTPDSNINTNVPIENIGTVHNLLGATLVLTKNNEIVQEIDLKSSVLLPSSRKKYNLDWTIPEHGKYQVKLVLNGGNSGKKVESMTETIYVIPPIWQLVSLALLVWMVLYLTQHRKRLGTAAKVLLKKTP